MNPNRLNRELKDLPGNLKSRSLPGGSIVSAVLDRQLMTWSDRGGASRIFGDLWSEYCWSLLSNGQAKAMLNGYVTSGTTVLRLDANPQIALQAGKNQLPNPDFLLLTPESDGRLTVRAVDAKFAFDRLRRVQVSPESIQALVEVSGSLVKAAIAEQLGSNQSLELSYDSGAFVGPSSLLNDYFYQQHTEGPSPTMPTDELQLVSINAERLFERTEEYPVMRLLRSVDDVSTPSPDSDVLLGMYYLRLACAVRWFESEVQAPLLSLGDPVPVEVDEIYELTKERLGTGVNAYGIVREWSREVEAANERQEQIRDAARLPIRMSEIRRTLEKAGLGEEKKSVRMVRGSLERTYMRRLIEEIGEIPAQPAAPIDAITERIRSVSRALKSEMQSETRTLVERLESGTRLS